MAAKYKVLTDKEVIEKFSKKIQLLALQNKELRKVLQPTDIEKYLKYQGKQERDKFGLTGMFIVSAKDIIDCVQFLKQ